jgi:hypothetical protein
VIRGYEESESKTSIKTDIKPDVKRRQGFMEDFVKNIKDWFEKEEEQ